MVHEVTQPKQCTTLRHSSINNQMPWNPWMQHRSSEHSRPYASKNWICWVKFAGFLSQNVGLKFQLDTQTISTERKSTAKTSKNNGTRCNRNHGWNLPLCQLVAYVFFCQIGRAHHPRIGSHLETPPSCSKLGLGLRDMEGKNSKEHVLLKESNVNLSFCSNFQKYMCWSKILYNEKRVEMENGSIFLCTLKFDKTPLDKKPSKAQHFKAALLLPWYKAFLKSPRFSSFNSR